MVTYGTGGVGLIPYVSGLAASTGAAIVLDGQVQHKIAIGDYSGAVDQATYHLPGLGSSRSLVEALIEGNTLGALVSAGSVGLDVMPCINGARVLGVGKGPQVTSAIRLKPLGTARDNLLNAVQNPKLKNIVNDLYRPGAKIGNGSSMAAFRLEKLIAQPLNGKMHDIKLRNYRKALQRVWQNRTNLSTTDKQITKQLLQDIQNELSYY